MSYETEVCPAFYLMIFIWNVLIFFLKPDISVEANQMLELDNLI